MEKSSPRAQTTRPVLFGPVIVVVAFSSPLRCCGVVVGYQSPRTCLGLHLSYRRWLCGGDVDTRTRDAS
jgi:hypothetical protein